MQKMANKVIWITGASSGIGEACAYLFAQQKTRLILTGTNEKKLQEVRNKCISLGSVCHILPYDLSFPENIEGLVKDALTFFGNIDIMFHNAGISQRSKILDTKIDVEEKIMQVNYNSPVLITKVLLPKMIANGGGTIAVTTSISGKFGFPLRSSYAASKFALYGFFETLHAEYYDKNIRVVFVCPGRINTNISYNAIDADGSKHGKLDAGQAKGMSVERAAKKIVKAIKNRQPEVFVGSQEILMVYIKRFFPGLARRIIRRIKAT